MSNPSFFLKIFFVIKYSYPFLDKSCIIKYKGRKPNASAIIRARRKRNSE